MDADERGRGRTRGTHQRDDSAHDILKDQIEAAKRARPRGLTPSTESPESQDRGTLHSSANDIDGPQSKVPRVVSDSFQTGNWDQENEFDQALQRGSVHQVAGGAGTRSGDPFPTDADDYLWMQQELPLIESGSSASIVNRAPDQDGQLLLPHEVSDYGEREWGTFARADPFLTLARDRETVDDDRRRLSDSACLSPVNVLKPSEKIDEVTSVDESMEEVHLPQKDPEPSASYGQKFVPLDFEFLNPTIAKIEEDSPPPNRMDRPTPFVDTTSNYADLILLLRNHLNVTGGTPVASDPDAKYLEASSSAFYLPPSDALPPTVLTSSSPADYNLNPPNGLGDHIEDHGEDLRDDRNNEDNDGDTENLTALGLLPSPVDRSDDSLLDLLTQPETPQAP